MTTATTASGSRPVLVDSSGWLEYLTSDAKAALFGRYLEGRTPVIVPTIVIFEVRKILLLRQTRAIADEFVGEAFGRHVVDFDGHIALAAAELGVRHQLPMADAIIFATSIAHGAQLVTTDSHFSGLPGATVL